MKILTRLLTATSATVALSLGIGCANTKANPTEDLKRMAYGHILARAIHQTAYFGVADKIDGRTDIASVAKQVSLNPDALQRIINVLLNHGIFTRNKQGYLEHNALSEPLKSQAKSTLKAALAKENDARRWQALGRIDIALTTGKSPFQELFGEGFYDYLEHNADAAALFNTGMKGFSVREDQAIAREFDFAPYKTIIDIGGGNGGLITEVLTKNQEMHGVLFDLKDAVEKSPALADARLTGRIKGQVGDFFKEITSSADLYVLKRVIHNWDFEHAQKILTNCRIAMVGLAKRLLIIEKILPKQPDGSFLVDSDLIGLSLGNGRERNEAEFRLLAQQSGFEIENIKPTSSGVSIMVLRPSKL